MIVDTYHDVLTRKNIVKQVADLENEFGGATLAPDRFNYQKTSRKDIFKQFKVCTYVRNCVVTKYLCTGFDKSHLPFTQLRNFIKGS